MCNIYRREKYHSINLFKYICYGIKYKMINGIMDITGNNKLYYKKYIMCLCIENNPPIYLNAYSKIYYDNKYNEKMETILDIISYDDIFNSKNKTILKGLDLGFFTLDFTYSKENFFVKGKKIKKEKFIYLSLIAECKEKDIGNTTFYDLSKKLNTKEYIRFCNDYQVKILCIKNLIRK